MPGEATGAIEVRVRYALSAGLGLLALALAAGALGQLSPALNGILAVGALMATALVTVRRPVGAPGRRLVAAGVLAIAALPLVARGGPLAPTGAALFFLGLSLVAPAGDGVPSALVATALFFGAWQALVAHVPLLWHARQWGSIAFSWFAGVGLRLGPTALGLPIFLLFLLFALTTAALPGGPSRWRCVARALLWVALLVGALVAYLWLQPPLASWLQQHWPASPYGGQETLPPRPTYLESLPLLFVLLWLATAIAGWRPGPLAAGWPLRRRALGWGLAGLVLLCAAVLVLGLDPGYTPRRGVVLFYDAGQLDWGRPEYGRYGARSGGTYGLWPDYLSLYGYEFRAGELSAENLAAARVVMLVNLQQALPAEEKARLLSWVEAGGGLVIWGEHTGFGTIREPLNDLLTALPGAPLRLRFDSAVPVRQGWAEGLDLLPHPALRGVADPLDLVIAVGASFDVAPPARPLIVGRFGHSDWGDPDNAMRNYVGDMRPNPDERLGDVVLAAEVQHGAGRIVVMGDTTPLGSVNLMTTMPFHARLLDWVAGEAAGWTPVLTGGLLGAVLLLAALVLVWRGRSRLALAAAALVLGLGLAGLDAWNEARSAPPLPAGPIAYVDAAHHGRFDRLLWEDTSTGGLAYNLSRAGLVPLLLRDLDAEALAGADLLVVVAPEQEYRQGEIDAVADWVEVGGQLLVTVGSEEAVASQALLARFGLSVGHVPLGPASVERAAGTVRFHEAWPVAAADGVPAETVVEAYGYPVVLYRAWGAGGVALVGDSEFLLGPNLEAETQYTEGNILLLRDLLHEWMAMAPREGTP